ncbi:MAG: SusC/RagA family TonB-linked outer membrane protein [Bacteroidaceae bacterium]|nr:SusC/RagA family TonB-linked outer membrane protein [Bacteroidaceae bacterium]
MMKRYIFTLFALLFAFTAGNAQTMINGKVTDSFGPVLGCSVVEIDANNRVVGGSTTNMDGMFAFKVKDTKHRLRISYIGMTTQTLSIGNRRTFNIKLTDSQTTIQETIVTGKKRSSDESFSIAQREVSMAVSRLNMEEVEGISVASADEALQGRIAGLDVVGGGTPGKGAQMRIRGTSTILGNAEPLIVVNDVPFESSELSSFSFDTATDEQYADLLNVNVDDIQEITVLKDAASTALWGSKGANGVIMIKTKRGTKSKTRVTYSYKLTGATQPSGYKLLNGDDFTMMMKQAYFNMTQLTGNSSHSQYDYPEFKYDPSWSEYEMYNNNTDWVDAVTQKGWTHDHYITVRGGGERASFYVSGGYYTRTGTQIGQEYNRFSTRAQLDYNISDRMTIRTEFQYTYGDNDQNYENLLNVAYKKMPNLSIYKQTADGEDTDEYYNILATSSMSSSQKSLRNPVAVARLARDNRNTHRVMPTIRLQYDFFDPDKIFLRYNGYVALDMNSEHRERFLPEECSNSYWDNSSVNSASDINSESLTILTENKLTWRSRFGNTDHDLQVMASWNTSSSTSSSQTTTSYGHPGSNITDASSTATLSNLQNTNSASRSVSFIGRLHYAYKGRYIIDGNVRMDGSTKFGDDNRYGWFPGVGAKWIISDEPFFNKIRNVVSLFAIRPSWGMAGRQPGKNYLYFNRMAIDTYGYMNTTAVYPSNIRLTNLKWEKVTSTNLGADLELLNGMITCTFDYYHKRTSDMLFPELTISSTSGFSTLSYKNVGIMDNDGWEVAVGLNKIIRSGKFDLSMTANFANNKNTIKEMDQVVLDKYNTVTTLSNTTSYPTRLQVGNSIGSIYGFRYKGVYSYSYDNYDKAASEGATCPVATDAEGNVMTDYKGRPKPMRYYYNSTNYQFQGGDAIYEDINHDGSIDQYDIVYLGNCNPKLTGGYGLTLRYAEFSANFFFNFSYGGKIMNQARRSMENMYEGFNQCTTVDWRWRKEGDFTDVPRAVYQEAYNSLPSDRYVEDGSYLRLKYITLRYALPKKLIKSMGIASVNAYLTINNLFCLTKYSGVDPEMSIGNFGLITDNSSTPRSKDWMLGLSVTF